ncbi:GNAT family N-acetyltransferase [Paracoccus cavernae]|uniref:GNAT family N-acetyltransferase n=1 Tax=Paracoccus cavernae TaxID=1571207 RepID=A0ABT8D2P9_9RHOB|nr:GNAT family N-acetyltransferase [Paracoccus cavernae]
MIGLTGTLIASSLAEAETIQTHLPRHLRLSRNEPGCLRFDISLTEDPFVWQIDVLFIDEAAFVAHQERTLASEWGRLSADITRDFTKFAANIELRDERPEDTAAILSLLAETFDGVSEARLVQTLREDGDLAYSLIAEAGGAILGHLALSPLASARPALAIAPLAVMPRAQGRGIASELIRFAIERAPEHLLVVLGEPDFYGRFGFRQVNWDSPFAGPLLQARGPNLPERARIAHAPAFASLG